MLYLAAVSDGAVVRDYRVRPNKRAGHYLAVFADIDGAYYRHAVVQHRALAYHVIPVQRGRSALYNGLAHLRVRLHQQHIQKSLRLGQYLPSVGDIVKILGKGEFVELFEIVVYLG